eukprot:scaffold7337_cov66-Skeletonema_dohrnii-CCMP3373.AAC.7
MSSSSPDSAGIPLPLYDGPPPTSRSPSLLYQPTISVQPSSKPSSTFLRASNSLVNSDRTTNNFWTNSEGGITPSSVGFWMIMSLIGLLLCLLRMKFVEKSQSRQVPSVVDDGDKKIDKMIQDMMDDLDKMQFDFQMPAPKSTKENLVGLEVEVHSTTSEVQENQDQNIPPSPNPHPAQVSAETLDGNQCSLHKLDPPVPPTSTHRRKNDNSKHKRRVGEEKDGRVREHRNRDKGFDDDSRKERHRNSDNNDISHFVEPPSVQPHQSDPDASPNQAPSPKGDKNYMRRGGERDRDGRVKEQKLDNELKRSQRSMSKSMSKAQEKLLKEKTALKQRLQKLEMKLEERHSVEASLEDALKHNEALERELKRNLEQCDEKQEECQALIVQLQQIQGALAEAEVESSDRQEVIDRLELQIKEQNDSLISCEKIIIGYKDDIQRLKNERNHTMTEKNKVVVVQAAQPNPLTPTPPKRKDDGKKKLYLNRHKRPDDHDKRRRRRRSANRYNDRGEPSPPRNIDDDDSDQSSATKTRKSEDERTWFSSMFNPARSDGDNADDGVSAIHSMFDCSSSGSYPSLASM